MSTTAPASGDNCCHMHKDNAGTARTMSGLFHFLYYGGKIHCLTVIGQIEGHYVLPAQNKTTKYEHVIPQLVAIEESRDIEGLLIILNTVGGDIEAGLAIAELIAGMKTPTVSLVLGGGHSIGVPLAASSAYSFIAPSATMTVHPVRMTGLVLGVPQTMSYFEQMQERIVRFVADNSRISADRFRSLMLATGQLVMDVGTVLDGEAAVRLTQPSNQYARSGMVSVSTSSNQTSVIWSRTAAQG